MTEMIRPKRERKMVEWILFPPRVSGLVNHCSREVWTLLTPQAGLSNFYSLDILIRLLN